MSFTFYDNIPAGPNNPSDDQPLMLQNNISTKGIIGIDHITFGNPHGGMHQQVHLPAFTTPSVVNGDVTDGSVIYSGAGIADTAYAQLYFKNARAIEFPVSLIRAYGVFDSAGLIIGGQSKNLDTINPITHLGSGSFQVKMLANAVIGDFYGVLITPSTDISAITNRFFYGYTINTNTQFTINFTDPTGTQRDPAATTFVVFQI